MSNNPDTVPSDARRVPWQLGLRLANPVCRLTKQLHEYDSGSWLGESGIALPIAPYDETHEIGEFDNLPLFQVKASTSVTVKPAFD